jgi:hypothetical protein
MCCNFALLNPSGALSLHSDKIGSMIDFMIVQCKMALFMIATIDPLGLLDQPLGL